MVITIDELALNLEYYLSLVKDNSIKIMKDKKVIAILKAPNNTIQYRYGDELIGFLPNGLTLEEAKEMRLSEI